MKIRWYAVQNGANYDWDYGSYNKRKAVKMALDLCKDQDYIGEEIRVAIIDEVYKVCDAVIIIRHGTCE